MTPDDRHPHRRVAALRPSSPPADAAPAAGVPSRAPDTARHSAPVFTRAARWRLAVWVLAASAALLASACAKEAAEEVESETVVPVKTAPATTGSIRSVVHATGTVAPAPDAELIVIAPETARIDGIPHADGERVAKGDVLVRFDIPALAADVQRQNAEVQRAQAQMANAKANQTRAHELFDRGIAARKEVEDADRGVADAEASLAQADASRVAATAAAARQIVRAAFDGVIAKRFHNPGDLVEATASDPVLRLIDPRRLEVVASVPISDAPRVAMGATGTLTSGAGGGPDVTLRVVSRPAQVEVGTASIPVRLAFAAAGNFSVGTPVQVDIEAEQHKDVVLIPASALVREGEETAVFVVIDEKAQRRPVRIGISDAEHIEIVSGVKTGELVIVEGQAGLPDGATVTLNSGETSKKPTAGEAADKEDRK